MIPPKPFDFSCESVMVETLRPMAEPPASLTAAVTIVENDIGVR